MPAALQLLEQRPITYQSAAHHENNIIKQLAYTADTTDLYQYLWQERQLIESLTAHHLGLTRENLCTVQQSHLWMRGSFNVCIPIDVQKGGTSKRVLMRCPLPHKVAEAAYPGTVEEKLRCEVGMYAWMQDHCSEVPIPHLFGFGMPSGSHFTHSNHRPWYIRFSLLVRRFLSALLRRQIPSHYTSNPHSQGLRTGYLLLEFVESGQMLSNTPFKQHQTDRRKANLFQGLAHIFLSLARIPQPRIGSFRFHDDGTVSLTNRPLSVTTVILENDGAPRITQINDTYNCRDAYLSDLLSLHDGHFLNQPNAVNHEQDCRLQMAVKALLRSVSHCFFKRSLRNGPFFLKLTDFHASNLLVDNEWNITCLIDLEWVCSVPVEMFAVPYWLTGLAIDEVAEYSNEYDEIRQEFMMVFKEQERQSALVDSHGFRLSTVMDEMWESKGAWYCHCVTSTNAMYSLFEDHICPEFLLELSSETEKIVSQLWKPGAEGIIQRKLVDKSTYDQNLRQLFGE